MVEAFLIKTEGGPHPGTMVVDSDHFPWPPPGFISDVGGKYIKVSESPDPPSELGRMRTARVATYQWRTNEQMLTQKIGE